MTPMKPQKNPRVFLNGNSGIFMAIYRYLLIFMDDHVWYLVWSMLRQFVPNFFPFPNSFGPASHHRRLGRHFKCTGRGHGSFSPPRSHAMAEAQLCWKPPKNSRAKTAAARWGRVVEHHWLGCVSQFTSGSQVLLTPDIPYEKILITRVCIYEPHSHSQV